MERAEEKRESFVWYKCKGSGREAASKEFRKMKKSVIRNKRSAGPCSMCVYNQRKTQEIAAKLDLLDLLRCQRVCRHMNLKQDIQEPSEKFFWPKEVSEVDPNEPNQEEEGEENILSIKEQLEILNTYLRQTYYYCVYCVTVYDDETDLMEVCPGQDRKDHYLNKNYINTL